MKPKTLALTFSLLACLVAAWLFLRQDGAPSATPIARDPGARSSAPTERIPEPEAVEAPEARRAEVPAKSESAAAPELPLTIVLVDDAQTPLAEVEVLALDGEGGSQRARTVAGGRATLEARTGRGMVYAKPLDALPWRGEVEFGAGEQRLVIPRGHEVSGWVTVDGALPPKPVPLALECDQALFGGDLPASAQEFLGLSRNQPSVIVRATNDGEGRFRFGGLAPGWSGSLRWERDLGLRRDGVINTSQTSLHYPEPRTGIALDLVRFPLLTGRVVDREGQPVPNEGLRVSCTVKFRGMYFGKPVLEDSGRFAVAVHPEFEGVSLRAETKDASATLEATRAEIGDDLDVGEIVLVAKPATSLTLLVRVVDPAGAPIPGAAVAVVGRNRGTQATNESGELKLESLEEGSVAMIVDAKGCWPKHVQFDVPAADPAVVVLERANQLTIVVETEAGLPPVAYHLQLSSGAQRFHSHELSIRFRSDPGVSGGGHSRIEPDGRQWATFKPVASGRYVIRCVPPDTPLRLALVGGLQEPLLEESIAPLRNDEQRELTVRLANAGRVLTGVVRDESGQPLAGAMFHLTEESDKNHLAGWNTDASGRFRVEGLVAIRVKIWVRLRGYVEWSRDELVLAEQMTELEIVLLRGRSATVEIVDALGRPAAIGTGSDWKVLTAARPGEEPRWGGSPTGPGVWAFSDLPAESLEVALLLTGRTFRTTLGASDTSARIEIPVPGSIEASWNVPEPTDEKFYRIVVAAKGSREPLVPTLNLREMTGTWSYAGILPGEYDVFVTLAGWVKEPEPVTTPQSVTIEADRLTRVSLQVSR